MKHLFLIALGASIGGVLRYLASKNLQLYYGQLFPVGTLFVNAAGSFVIGFLYHLFDHVLVTSDIRSFLTIGFLGGFTTYSTYSLETINMLKDGEVKLALWNILLNNILCLIMVILGMMASRLLLKIIRQGL